MDIHELLKTKMKNARKTKKLTQQQVSELINLDPYYYNKIETGKVIPSFKVIMKIVDVLEFSIDDLIKPDEKSPKYHAILDLLNKCEEKDLEFLLNIISDFVKYKNRGWKKQNYILQYKKQKRRGVRHGNVQ